MSNQLNTTNMTQNNTSAVEISTIISDLNKHFANMVNNKDRYSRGIPSIINTIVELGAENVFYMHRDYHGLYEDDYCSFFYWDNVNGKVIEGYWTTAGACPDFSLYTDKILTIHEAEKYGLINMEAAKKFNIEKTMKRINLTRETSHREMMLKYNPLVQVEGGRKWRGIGYYVGEVVTQKSPYYPATTEAKVLSLEDFQIHYCNPKYIQLVERDELVEGYIQWATDIINEVVENNMYSSFFDMKGIDWEIKSENFSFENYVECHRNSMAEYLISTAYDARVEEEKKMLAAKRAEQYSSIIEWVKTKTDKTTTSEQIALATKVLFKKY